MKLFSSLLVVSSLFAVSCERHEFDGPDGTKQLNQPHGAGYGKHGADHKEHAATPGHATEKKAAH